MKKILAFGASSSKNSINKKLATFVAHSIEDATATVIDLNDFEMPIYSIDREKENGIPEKAQHFKNLIESHDAVVISLAEHNGTSTTAFKNILDWSSRLEGSLWAKKPMFLLSSSPGKRGGATVMGLAKTYLPFMGANIVAHFSLPSFYQNFSEEKGIIEPDLSVEFKNQLKQFHDSFKLEFQI